MRMLNARTERFKAQRQDENVCLSDDVINPLTELAANMATALLASRAESQRENDIVQKSTNKYITIDVTDAKKSIVNAFSRFDPELGKRAHEILHDDTRLNLNINDGPMQRVRPAGLSPADAMIPPEDLVDRWLYPVDHNEEQSKAIIDFDYNGTIDDLIYLGHEVGHAIVDDMQNEIGYTYSDNPLHMAEIQAYFFQLMLYDHLIAHEEAEISDAVHAQFSNEMQTNILNMPIGIIALQARRAIDNDTDFSIAYEYYKWFSDDLEHHPRYDEIQTTIDLQRDGEVNALKEQLDDQIGDFLHGRPPQFMIALGIFKHEGSGSEPAVSQSHYQALLGRQGSKGITEILSQFGYVTPDALGHHLMKTNRSALYNEDRNANNRLQLSEMPASPNIPKR